MSDKTNFSAEKNSEKNKQNNLETSKSNSEKKTAIYVAMQNFNKAFSEWKRRNG
jgi:hypothetical protein